MSDTPRTDTEALKWGPHDDVMNVVIPADFARELERDLGAANRSCDACLREIDSLRSQLNAKSPEVDLTELNAWRDAWCDSLPERAVVELDRDVIPALTRHQPQGER